jgi:hypothetical protein
MKTPRFIKRFGLAVPGFALMVGACGGETQGADSVASSERTNEWTCTQSCSCRTEFSGTVNVDKAPITTWGNTADEAVNAENHWKDEDCLNACPFGTRTAIGTGFTASSCHWLGEINWGDPTPSPGSTSQ